MTSVRVGRTGAVDCRASLDFPLPAVSVWGQVRDFRRFASQDFFHADVEVEGGVPRAGAGLVLHHRYAVFRVRRVGRILRWREGTGYGFSDLSQAGPRRGFPHVFSYRLEPRGTASTRLHVRVRGRWTARSVPRPLARLWLRWVFGAVVRSVRNELLAYQAWRELRDRKR